MKQELKQEILEALPHFMGTEQIWEHRTFAFSIYLSDGCNYLKLKAQFCWFFDLVASHQAKLKHEDFQCWKLSRKSGNEFEITCEGGDENQLLTQRIPFSDFPLDELRIWVIRDGSLICMLPTEY